MRKEIDFLSGILCLSIVLSTFMSCSLISPDSSDMGGLRIAFSEEQAGFTRSSAELPDTGEFSMAVSDSKGNIVYDGTCGACPELLEVEAGTYYISVRSSEFSTPAFSSPQYGDDQCVAVPAGGVADVKLLCTQVNSGVRLKIDRSFLEYCPDGVLFLKSEKGKLMYGYSEKRIAYFLPGSVSLMLSQGGTDKVLMSKVLEPQEVLTLGVSAVSSDSGTSLTGGRIAVAVDTSRFWIGDSYVIGGDNKGSGEEKALTVSQALASVGEEDVWVSGYIVGGDLTSSSASFEGPFTSRTNMLLGSRSSSSDKSSCLSVQLPAGDLREAMNLVDNPSLLGSKVALKGDIVEAYYGIPGLKNISEYIIY